MSRPTSAATPSIPRVMPSQFSRESRSGRPIANAMRHAGERHGGEQQPRGRAGQALLGRAQEVPRQDDLDDRVGQHRLPPAHHRRDLAAEERQRQQQDRGQGRPPEDHHRGIELAHRDLDEQVRDAPGDPERGEQDQPTSSHQFILVAATDTVRRGAAELARYPANPQSAPPHVRRNSHEAERRTDRPVRRGIGAPVARGDQPFASSSSVSITRFEKPHSLSYQATTLTCGRRRG